MVVWAVFHRRVSARVIIIESVAGFDDSVLHSLLGDIYQIVCIWVSPKHVGVSLARRKRKYFIMIHRARCVFKHDPQVVYNMVCPA